MQDPDTAQVATIPAEVVTEVASRRDRASTVADSSLADTLALLLWLTQNLVSEDLQMLATQVGSNNKSVYIKFRYIFAFIKKKIIFSRLIGSGSSLSPCLKKFNLLTITLKMKNYVDKYILIIFQCVSALQILQVRKSRSSS